MADVKLGITGSEYNLPVLRYIGGPPGLPVSIEPQTEEAKTSDGSSRWAFFEGKRQWSLAWGYLTYAELLVPLLRLVNIKGVLHFQPGWESTTIWYDVVIVSFSYEFIDTGIKKFKRFKADMTLREA